MKFFLSSLHSFLHDLFVKVRYRKKKKAQNLLLVYSPSSCNSQGWAKADLGTRSFFQFFHMDGTGSDTSAIFHRFSQAVTRALGMKWHSREMNWCPHGILVSQAGTQPDSPQRWFLDFCFNLKFHVSTCFLPSIYSMYLGDFSFFY